MVKTGCGCAATKSEEAAESKVLTLDLLHDAWGWALDHLIM